MIDVAIVVPSPIPAAEYVRMSTEHQQYSTANQEDAIREYAARRGYKIVRTYTDSGKSGLNVAGREQLKQLISDVQNSQVDFRAILVYDISRWGRFQDADESAYYEYLCKRAGIEVHYCAEQFENDGGPTSTIIKSVKRAMAGEYSRELSSKVFKGQCRLIELGFRQGGSAGFGLRRLLINQAGEPKGELRRGDRKSLQTDRVILAPGPEEEIRIVHWIYDQFVTCGRSEVEIAGELNTKGVSTDLGRPWTSDTIHAILTNEKYIGNNIYNRTSFKLKRKHVHNAPEMWIRADGAFTPIVEPSLFYAARELIATRRHCFSNEEMLAKLKSLLASQARLTSELIDAANGPCSASYRSRFGSLLRAYHLAGFQPDRDYSYVEINRNLRELYPKLVSELTARLHAVGATVVEDRSSDLLLINGEYSASLILSRMRQTASGSLRWCASLLRPPVPDITILARMDAENAKPADYYLLPIIDVLPSHLVLRETNGAELETYQFEDLSYFANMAKRRKCEVAA